MTHMPRNEEETFHQKLWWESRKVFVIFLRSCAIRSECQSKINKRFDMVPGSFERVPDDNAVPL